MTRRLSYIFILLAWPLFGCEQELENAAYESYSYTVDSTVAADAAIEKIIAPFRDSMDQLMDKQLLLLGNDLEKDRDNGSLGYFMCDLLREAARYQYQVKADIAVLNLGGIRRPYLKKGAVTRGMVFELMPFENRVYVLEANAEQVRHLAQDIVKRGGAPVSGISIHATQDAVRVEVGGKPLQQGNHYTVLCSDYQYNGGDNYGYLQEMKKIGELGLVRDLLLNAMKLKVQDSAVLNYQSGRRVEIDQ